MLDTNEPNDEEDPLEDGEGDPLSGWGRFSAGLLGFALAGAGAVAVFITSNQAGSVALILGGIVFLLMSLGGNPILSLGHGDTQMRFATKRRQRVIDQAGEASPQQAHVALETLRTVDPDVNRDASFVQISGQVYERLIQSKISGLFPEMHVEASPRDVRADFSVTTPESKTLLVDVRYRRSEVVFSKDISALIGAGSLSSAGVLLVGNGRLSRAATEMLNDARQRDIKVDYVQWRDDQDDIALRQSIDRLLA